MIYLYTYICFSVFLDPDDADYDVNKNDCDDNVDDANEHQDTVWLQDSGTPVEVVLPRILLSFCCYCCCNMLIQVKINIQLRTL